MVARVCLHVLRVGTSELTDSWADKGLVPHSAYRVRPWVPGPQRPPLFQYLIFDLPISLRVLYEDFLSTVFLCFKLAARNRRGGEHST